MKHKAADATRRQCAESVADTRLGWVRVVIPYPGLEKVAQDVQGFRVRGVSAQEFEELPQAASGAPASRCTSIRTIGSFWREYGVLGRSSDWRRNRGGSRRSGLASRIQDFHLRDDDGFERSVGLEGSRRACGRDADPVDDVHALYKRGRRPHIPSAWVADRDRDCRPGSRKTERCRSGHFLRAPGPPCRACSATRCPIRC